MKKTAWFERQFAFGLSAGMLPFYLERLEGTIARLEKKVSNIPEDVLSNKLDGKWSVKQNIGHLAEVDEIALKRIDEMISKISPISPAVFEPKQDYNALPVGKILKLFRGNRTKNIERYSRLSESELLMASLHPRLKMMMTPVDLAWFDAEHDDHHLVRINEILEGMKIKK